MEVLGPRIDRLILLILWLFTIAASGAFFAFVLKHLWANLKSLTPTATPITFSQAFSLFMIELLIILFALIVIDSCRIVFKQDKATTKAITTQQGVAPYSAQSALSGER